MGFTSQDGEENDEIEAHVYTGKVEERDGVYGKSNGD